MRPMIYWHRCNGFFMPRPSREAAEVLLHLDEIMVGERGRSHDVLATSLPIDVAKAIAHHLDLPGQLPPGFDLLNYVSGFPHADRYVIARTSLDSAADRQGMVFSHALVADADAVANLTDITPVFERLEPRRPELLSASKTTVETARRPLDVEPSAEFCDMLAARSHGPVVIGDPQALEPAISAIWPNLLPGIRARFRFRLSFRPRRTRCRARSRRRRASAGGHALASRTRTPSRLSSTNAEDARRPIPARCL